MHRTRTTPALLMFAVAFAGCGDDGRATTVGQSGSTTAPVTSTATAPTTTGDDATAAPTTSDGSNSNSNSNSSTRGEATTEPTTSLTGSSGITSAATGTTSDTPGTTTDNTTGMLDPCGGTMGAIDFSYLWVANTSQGTVSKINTMTLMEEGRYYADPNPATASTSRTSVNIDGHFVAVSNRGTGTVTKIAANVDDCVDKNGDGMIQTSANKDDILPWGTDECVLWNITVSPPPDSYTHGPRGTAWAPGTFNQDTCKYEDQKVWVGWMDAPGHGNMGAFNGETGAQESTVSLDNWSVDVNYAPYGAAADGFGNIWFTSVYREVGRINTTTLELKRWPSGVVQPYGMTVDAKGNPWFGPYNNQPVAMFDAKTEQFVQVPGSSENHRGIAVDGDGMVWVASNPGGTHGCGLNQIDSNTMTQVQFHTFPECGTPVGVSIDVEGFVWMVDYNGWAYRMDPETYEKVQVIIPGDHYTYSDMTGGGLQNAITPQ